MEASDLTLLIAATRPPALLSILRSLKHGLELFDAALHLALRLLQRACRVGLLALARRLNSDVGMRTRAVLRMGTA